MRQASESGVALEIVTKDLTALAWSDVVYEILMIEYRVAVTGQLAERLAAEWCKRYRKESTIWIMRRVRALQDEQPNEYLSKFVLRRFVHKVKEIRNASVS